MGRRYRSKVDLWLALVLVSAIAVSIAAIFAIGFVEGRPAMWTMVLNGVLGILLPLWLLFGTVYVLDQDTLRIRCGPMRWTIPVRDIRHVEPTRSGLSSPALSLDRIRIDYASNRSLMISPRDSAQFLKDLEFMRNRR